MYWFKCANTRSIKLVNQLPDWLLTTSSQSFIPQADKQAYSQSTGTDEGTAGRHFQLTDATWLGTNWYVRAKRRMWQGCWTVGNPEREVTEGRSSMQTAAEGSASTNLSKPSLAECP